MKHKIKLEAAEIEANNYHLFLSLKVNGQHCRLLLDTGASRTVFDSERVLRFVKPGKIKANESKSVGLGVADMETKVAKLKHITRGKLVIPKMEVAILPIGHVNQTYAQIGLEPIDGVLGSDFLMKYDAVINFGRLYLRVTL